MDLARREAEEARREGAGQQGYEPEELAGPVPEEWEGRGYEEIKAEFERLKAKVEEFGPINMSALEEFRENEERFNFLSQQRQDIELTFRTSDEAIPKSSKRNFFGSASG